MDTIIQGTSVGRQVTRTRDRPLSSTTGETFVILFIYFWTDPRKNTVALNLK